MDDFGNNFATAFPILTTGAELGALETDNDVDVFSVDLVAGQNIQVRVSGRTDGFTPNDGLTLNNVSIQTEVVDRFLNTVPSPILDFERSDGEADFSTLNFTAPTTDTYYITVGGDDVTPDDGISQAIGTYFLTVELSVPAIDDHADSAALATVIDGSTTVSGEIGFPSPFEFSSDDDDDVFALQLDAGDRIVIDGRGQPIGAPLGGLENIQLSLSLDALENLIQTDESFDASSSFPNAVPAVIDYTAEVSGTYLINVTGIQDFEIGSSNNTGSYELSVDVSRNTTPVDRPSFFEGTLESPGEADFYEVTVTGGDILYVNARTMPGVDPLEDVRVAITTLDGQEIRSASSIDGDPAAFFFFLSGTFLVQMTGAETPEAGDQTGSYEIAFGYGNGFLPDLSIQDLEVEVDATDGMFTVSGFITNSGETGSSETDLRLHLTERDTFSSLDPVLFEETGILIPDPFAGRESRTFVIPENLESGTYRIGAFIDPNRRVFEQDERNNTAISAEFTYTRPVFTLQDLDGVTRLRGTNRDEIFNMLDDGARDVIRDFNPQRDKIDVSAWGATSIDDLTISNLRRKDGTVNWIEIGDNTGESESLLRMAEGFPLVNAILTADDFIFSDAPPPPPPATGNTIHDSTRFDRLTGTDADDTFVMVDDGTRDVVLEFDVTADLLDVSAWGATDVADIEISNVQRRDGSTSYVAVIDADGQAELILRYAGNTALDAAQLDAGNFVFAEAPPEPPAPTVVPDTAALDMLRGTTKREIFELSDDGQRDIIRDFDVENDQISLVNLGITRFEDLSITELLRGSDGRVSWVQINDPAGEAEAILRFAGIQFPLAANQLTASNFVFSDTPIAPPVVDPTIVADGAGADRIDGTDAAEIFTFAKDRLRDQLRGFDPSQDRLDFTAFDATGVDELEIVNLVRSNGSVSWVEIRDTEGTAELILRLADPSATDASALTADLFDFG